MIVALGTVAGLLEPNGDGKTNPGK